MQTSKFHKMTCPVCSRSESFRVDLETGCTYCHSCKVSSHLKKMGIDFDDGYRPIVRNHRKDNKVRISEAQRIWESLKPCVAMGSTADYLIKRGIMLGAWIKLGLREGRIWGRDCFAVYPFRGVDGTIHCINFTYYNDQGGKEKRYVGSKKTSYALLHNASPCIIAEGLENALIVRQEIYNNKSGILIAGDCGGYKTYAEEFQDQLKHLNYIVVEDPDPAGQKATMIFCNAYNFDRVIKTPPGNDAVDWIGQGNNPL